MIASEFRGNYPPKYFHITISQPFMMENYEHPLKAKALIYESGRHLAMFNLLWAQKVNANLVSKAYNSYDILIDLRDNTRADIPVIGKEIIRVPVKVAEKPESKNTYNFIVRHDDGTPYTVNENDVYGLVAMDIQRVAWLTRNDEPLKNQRDFTQIKPRVNLTEGDFERYRQFPFLREE